MLPCTGEGIDVVNRPRRQAIEERMLITLHDAKASAFPAIHERALSVGARHCGAGVPDHDAEAEQLCALSEDAIRRLAHLHCRMPAQPRAIPSLWSTTKLATRIVFILLVASVPRALCKLQI